MAQVGIQKSGKFYQNRTSMFLKHASTIFSRKQVLNFTPVNFTKNRNFSKSMFAGVLGMIFCSVFIAATFGCGAVFALDSSANFSVVVPEVNTLEITLSDSNLVLNLTPQMAEASFGSKDLTITVGTSNITGYNLMMNTSNTALTSAAEDTIETLEEKEEGYICSTETCNFTLNRWGFKKSTDATYNYIPASISIASNDAPTNGEDTTINFASRVDAQQPAGTYSTTLTFVATVNPTSMTIADISTLQDFATLSDTDFYDVLDSMTEGEAYEKPDSRDEKTYNIAKLADGNIWFLDNLRLDPSAKDLTSADTNVASTVSASTFVNKTSGWTGSTTVFTEAWFNLDSENIEVSYGSGTNYAGGYYNYCAASASSYCMNSSAGSSNATQDLCPAGWRMPTGGFGGEYATLAQTITGTSGTISGTDLVIADNDRADFMEAAHIALPGQFWNASASGQGSTGQFWSSTFSGPNGMRVLELYASTAVLTYGSGRDGGKSIRCVVKTGTEMQNLSASTVARKLANVNNVASLVDLRDYQPYTVAKLADNKVWMTKNLNLPGGTALSASDTNVSSDYINSFSTSNNLTKTGDTLVLPASSTIGFGIENYSYVYNSDSATCASSSPCYSYYSWDAATLGSGRSITTNNADAEHSICPKGWKLPNTYDGTASMAADYDFRALMIAYGGSYLTQTYTTSTSPTGAAMYGKISTSTVPGFLLPGYYDDNSFYEGGSYGRYWSSTSSNSTYARALLFNPTTVYSANNNTRRYGFAVRCLLAN